MIDSVPKLTYLHSVYMPFLRRIPLILAVVLTGLLPLQNVLVQLLVQRVGLPAAVSLWKEGVAALLLVLLEGRIIWLNRQSKTKNFWSIAWPQVLAFSLIGLAVGQSLGRVTATSLAFGFRFELWFVLVLAIVLSWLQIEHLEAVRKVSRRIRQAVVYGFFLVALLSVGILLFGEGFLQSLGFGASTSEVITTSPLVNVIDGGGWNNFPRLGGGFSTPNHFAAYLLLSLPIFLQVSSRRLRWGLVGTAVVFIALSYARFAWLGLVFFALAYLRQKTTRAFWKRIWLGVTLFPVGLALFATLTPNLAEYEFLPTFLRKPSSSSLHHRHTMASLEVIQRSSPEILAFGYGLGSSGPASRYFDLDENPLHLRFNEVSYKWFLFEPDITIPENWYLQLILNGGLIYALGYIFLVAYPAYLFRDQPYVQAAYLALLLGNFLLHIFENQTVALYYSLLLVAAYPRLYKKQTLALAK